MHRWEFFPLLFYLTLLPQIFIERTEPWFDIKNHILSRIRIRERIIKRNGKLAPLLRCRSRCKNYHILLHSFVVLIFSL